VDRSGPGVEELLVLRTTAALAVLVAAGALCAQAVAAKPKIAHRHELSALFTLDKGWRPVSDWDLAPYSNHFHKILGSCRINAESLTNTVLWLSDKASDLGHRIVTNLMMLKAITRRITWTGRMPCQQTFDNAEGHMEAGGP